jgi:hypothetical protein
MSDDDSSVLQQLVDRSAITDLLTHYCWLCDSQRLDRIAEEIFTQDAVAEYGFGPMVGSQAIDRFFRNAAAAMDGTVHVLSNVVVTVEGDQATARSYVTASERFGDRTGLKEEEGADFVVLGCYRDTLVRTDRGWRIEHRDFGHLPPVYAVGRMPDAMQLSAYAEQA